ncbi:sensor histidine kinase [Micromonosporaceae bacterium Da 78-11]
MNHLDDRRHQHQHRHPYRGPAAPVPPLAPRLHGPGLAYPGTGLGLVITRTIIERHGGTINLADHTGPGTTFKIRIPLEATTPDDTGLSLTTFGPPQ